MELTRQLCGEDFDILSGDDDKTYTMMVSPDISASGVISVVSNVAPGTVVDMVHYILDGNEEAASVIAQALQPLFSIVTVKTTGANTIWHRCLQSTQSACVQDADERAWHAIGTLQATTGKNDPRRLRSRLTNARKV